MNTMIGTQSPRRETDIRLGTGSPYARLQIAEYAFYLNIFYANMGDLLGLSVGSVGIAMRIGLVALCILRLGQESVPILRSLFSVFLCAASLIFIQVFVHGSPMSDGYIRAFVPWVFGLIITKSLLIRPGFLRRSTTVLFLIGASALPFLSIGEVTERAGIANVTLGHPNSLAAWFGFCAVAFTIRGFEARRPMARLTCFGIAFLSVFVVALTVGRAALGAAVVAIAIALRKQLKRSFIPILAIFLLFFVGFASGLFDYAIGLYTQRMTTESGRFLVWPLAAKRLVDSPLVGVPAAQLGTIVPGMDDEITPHSGFLFIGLGGGFITLAFFISHWWRSFKAAFKPSPRAGPDAPYLLPLLTFSFLIMLQANAEFQMPWCVLSVCACLQYLPERRPALSPSVVSAVPVNAAPNNAFNRPLPNSLGGPRTRMLNPPDPRFVPGRRGGR